MATVTTTEDLINVTIKYVDNVSDPTLAETTKRARYLEFAQEKVHDLVIEHEWLWMQVEADVVPDANGRVELPARFMDVGRHGCLVNKSNGCPFEHVPLQEMRQQRYSSANSGNEYKYSIGVGEIDDEARYGWVPKGWAGQTLTLSYRKTAPELEDDSGDTGLLEIPRQYREAYLVYAMRSLAYDDKGDNRASKWEVRAEMALNAGIEAERPQKDEGLVMGGSGYADQC